MCVCVCFCPLGDNLERPDVAVFCVCFCPLGDSLERVCSVYVVCRLTSSRHIIGQVKVGAAASWQWLTQALYNLFIRHMQSLHRWVTRPESQPRPQTGVWSEVPQNRAGGGRMLGVLLSPYHCRTEVTMYR